MPPICQTIDEGINRGEKLLIAQETTAGTLATSGAEIPVAVPDFRPLHTAARQASETRNAGGPVNGMPQLTTTEQSFGVDLDGYNYDALMAVAFSQDDAGVAVTDLTNASVSTVGGVSTVTSPDVDPIAVLGLEPGMHLAMSGLPTGNAIPFVVIGVTTSTIVTTSEWADLGTDAGPSTYKALRNASYRIGECEQSLTIEASGNHSSAVALGCRCSELGIAASTSAPQTLRASFNFQALDYDYSTDPLGGNPGRFITTATPAVGATQFHVAQATTGGVGQPTGLEAIIFGSLAYSPGRLPTDLIFSAFSVTLPRPLVTDPGATSDRGPAKIHPDQQTPPAAWSLTLSENTAAEAYVNAILGAGLQNFGLRFATTDGDWMLISSPATKPDAGVPVNDGGINRLALTGIFTVEGSTGYQPMVTISIWPGLAAALA
jgi:hypothetical protein